MGLPSSANTTTAPSAIGGDDRAGQTRIPRAPAEQFDDTMTAQRNGGTRDIQSRLTGLGFDTGGVDGIAGARTDQAIRDFQRANGLAVDGIVGPQTRAALAAADSPASSGATSLSAGSQTESLVERQRDIDAIVTASPAAAQAMQGGLNDDVTAAPDRIEQIDRDIDALGTSSPSVTGALRQERNDIETELADYNELIDPDVPESFIDRQGTIDSIVTASPAATSAMQEGLDKDVEASRDRLDQIDRDIDALGTSSPSVTQALRDERAAIEGGLGALGELVGSTPIEGNGGSELPEQVDVVRVSLGGSVGPGAAGRDLVYEIEYLPDGEALVTRRIDTGAGGTLNWRVGFFVDAGDHAEGGAYLGGGVQGLAEGITGETFRVPADEALAIIQRDTLHVGATTGADVALSQTPFGILDPLIDRAIDQVPGLGSPLMDEGTAIRTFSGVGTEVKADALLEIGIHDAEWLGPLENFFGQSAGAEASASAATTLHRNHETGESSIRFDADASAEADVAFLNIMDENGESVFGIDGSPNGQAAFSLEVISNGQGDVTDIVVGTTTSNGDSVNRREWRLDASDPDIAARVQAAMSGPTGFEPGVPPGVLGDAVELTQLAMDEGSRQDQTYHRSGVDYGVGADFFPVPDLGAGGSLSVEIERLGTETA